MLQALYIIARAMSNAETTYSVAERVATITLNRPDKLNAWTAVMEQDVRAAMDAADNDESVRVIVVVCSEHAGFCS
jgi:enoyl-CoA hydratase/carnithine racemase